MRIKICYSQIHAELNPLFKLNPFIATGTEWKERRNDLAPAFTMLRVSKCLEIRNFVVLLAIKTKTNKIH